MSRVERVIEKYERGIFRYDTPLLDFSCNKIEIATNKEEIVAGSFQIIMPTSEKLEGYIHTSSLRMTCTIGMHNEDHNTYQVNYSFDSKNLEEGTIFKGKISFITILGEYYIPFSVKIHPFQLESSIGNIKNLFHFTNLAKTNWAEALQMYYSPVFPHIFRGNEEEFQGLYRGLAHETGNEKNLDEFLVLIKKKQQVDYIIEEKEFIIDDYETQTSNRIHIKKNGWGYIHLDVIVDGDFISVQKNVITGDDFLGNTCTLQFVIDEYRLHHGTNFGQITLVHGLSKTQIPITVQPKIGSEPKKKRLLQMKREAEVIMTSFYIDFRIKKISAKEWTERSLEMIERITIEDENNYEARLYQAQMLISADRKNEAKWILDRVEALLPEEGASDYHAYYLYLTTLIDREKKYVNYVTQVVSMYCKEDPDNWRLNWILLYLREEYTSNPHRRFEKLKEMIDRGANSPILFVDAVNLMNANPKFLEKLEGVELRIISYALRKSLLSEMVHDQIMYLLIKVRIPSKNLLMMLFDLYASWEDEELLEEICKILIQLGYVDEKYYPWYEMSVAREFQITKLFECYLLSRPKECQNDIPKRVLLYFAYECTLPYSVVARLYRYIHVHQNRNQEMYQSYKKSIQTFMLKQLEQRHMNEDLAYLYEHLLVGEMMNQERAEILSEIGFQCKVRIEIPEITQVILIYDKLKGENRYFVQDQEVVFSIFGDSFQLFFQDQEGNRYLLNQEYTLTRWIPMAKIEKLLKPFHITQIGYSLYLCENKGDYILMSGDTEEHYANLLNSTQVAGRYKRNIRAKILPYYYEKDMMDEMDACLFSVPFKETTLAERKELIRFMVLRGMYNQAYDWVIQNGPEGMDEKTIYRMISRMIRRGECTSYDEKMVEITYYAFASGEWDEFTVAYLAKHYEGMLKELRDIWKAATEEHLDVHTLEERILTQILFSGVYILEKEKIFSSYVKESPNEKLIHAYLSLQAYEYFVKQKVLDGKIFLYFLKPILLGKEVNEVCLLALVKYLIENKETLDEDEKMLVWRVYCDYSNRGIFLPMFAELAELEPKMFGLRDKTFIEYRCDPKKEVTIHYILHRNGEEANQYRKESMKNICYGIFVKDFILFFGETLQYYITESYDGEEKLTESGEISKSDITDANTGMRYFALNDIAIAGTLQDLETVNRLGEEYSQKAYITRKLFRMI